MILSICVNNYATKCVCQSSKYHMVSRPELIPECPATFRKRHEGGTFCLTAIWEPLGASAGPGMVTTLAWHDCKVNLMISYQYSG